MDTVAQFFKEILQQKKRRGQYEMETSFLGCNNGNDICFG